MGLGKQTSKRWLQLLDEGSLLKRDLGVAIYPLAPPTYPLLNVGGGMSVIFLFSPSFHAKGLGDGFSCVTQALGLT